MTEEAPATAAPAKKRGCVFYGLVGLGVIFGLSVLGSLLNPQPAPTTSAGSGGDQASAPAAEPSPAAQEVTAADLAQAYSDNEVAAQQRFGDRPLVVTGTIEAVELDIMDEPVVRLRTGQDFRFVSASFEDDQAQATAALSKGQQVRLLCDDVSEVASTPLLDDCVVQ